MELPRVGQTCIHTIGGDQYAKKIISIEKDIIVLASNSGIRRCKKNRNDGGYGELEEQETGRWKYRHTAKYRHLSTWYPIEGEAQTCLDPGF